MSIGLGTRFNVGMEEVFSHGAYFRTIEPDNDFDLVRSKASDTGDAVAGSGIPFPQVAFDGLSLRPWVDGQRCKNKRHDDRECRGRVAYSLRATGMRPVGARSAAAGKPGSAR